MRDGEGYIRDGKIETLPQVTCQSIKIWSNICIIMSAQSCSHQFLLMCWLHPTQYSPNQIQY